VGRERELVSNLQLFFVVSVVLSVPGLMVRVGAIRSSARMSIAGWLSVGRMFRSLPVGLTLIVCGVVFRFGSVQRNKGFAVGNVILSFFSIRNFGVMACLV
jgi:hypothetical protein